MNKKPILVYLASALTASTILRHIVPPSEVDLSNTKLTSYIAVNNKDMFFFNHVSYWVDGHEKPMYPVRRVYWHRIEILRYNN